MANTSKITITGGLESHNINQGKYHDIECCEWTRGVDTLLSRYADDREKVAYLIMNDPETLVETIWTREGPLAIDNGCLCKMGNGERRSPFSCAQCSNMRRLIDFRLGGVERPFQLECGQSAGKNLIVTSSEVDTPSLAWDEEAVQRKRMYTRQYSNLSICGTPNVGNMRCITGDPFTIRTLISWMIYKMFSDNGLPHSPLMHTAFICSGVGYSLYDMPSIGTISELHKIEAFAELEPNIVRSIITQLLVILMELSAINFSHGAPSIHSLIFTKDPVSYSYDGVHVQGPITLQIADLWNSSATFNEVHYFPRNVESSMYLERTMFVPEITSKMVSMAHCHDVGAFEGETPMVCPTNMRSCPDATTYDVCKKQNVTLYRLTSRSVDIYAAMRHIGFPLYVGSFDFYCFMVSLMCDEPFYRTVVNDDLLYRLWSMMWLAEDLTNVERLIKSEHSDKKSPHKNGSRAASNTIIAIIRGAWLRCDIVGYIWSLIKRGW